LEFEECVERAGELTIKGGLIAEHEIEGMRVIAQIAKDNCCARRIGRDGSFTADHFEVEAGALNVADAQLTPARDGHGFDQRGFGRRARLEFAFVGVKEIFETRLGFGIEHDGVGQNAMAGTVFRRVDFALGRNRPARAGAVGTGGLEASFGTHT
jgi:hypothetical protein